MPWPRDRGRERQPSADNEKGGQPTARTHVNLRARGERANWNGGAVHAAPPFPTGLRYVDAAPIHAVDLLVIALAGQNAETSAES